jgi:fermentation-respiration switch protein FrsA (DUF1100 family)
MEILPSRKKVHFPSGGKKCAAWHYLGRNRGCVVMTGGFAVNKEPATDLFAKRLNEAGFAVLAFEYRRIGESEGHPRLAPRLRDEPADWHAAIQFARTLPVVDPTKVAIWAFSSSGGHIFPVAARNVADASEDVLDALPEASVSALTARRMTSTVDKSWSSGGPRQRQRLRAGLISAGVLSSLLAGLVLAIPDLHTVANRVAGVHWEWVTLAAGLELASCVGYLLAFQGIFEELPRRFAALVAASEQAFGAVVPVGGAGGIAAGGWLLARRGMPLRRIAEGSAVLFLLTSATNVVALLVAAAGLALGLFPGPHDPVRTVVPAVVALSVLAIFLSLARQTARGGAPRLPWVRSRA